jgi:hypothetical protein
MKVLFLDVDGVLNRHDCDKVANCNPIHRNLVERLNWVLLTTGAKVVLSSAWRYMVHRGELNMSGLDWLLRSHGLAQDRLIGITKRDTMISRMTGFNGDPASWPAENERGQQITDWLIYNNPEVYAVVDDLDLGISAAGHPFVQTDGSVGLTWEDAFALHSLLMRNPHATQ